MERIYRVMENGETLYAVERNGELARATLEPGDVIATGTPFRHRTHPRRRCGHDQGGRGW